MSMLKINLMSTFVMSMLKVDIMSMLKGDMMSMLKINTMLKMNIMSMLKLDIITTLKIDTMSMLKMDIMSMLKMNLKAYSLMLKRGRSQNFWNVNFLHIFVALLKEAHFPKGVTLKSFQYEMRAIFTEKSRTRDFFNTEVHGSNETHIIMHKLKT